MTKRDQDKLQRKVQRDMFEDRATIEGPMFDPAPHVHPDLVELDNGEEVTEAILNYMHGTKH